MLLYTKAQHSVKLMVYHKPNKSVSRGKIISFTYHSLTAATHVQHATAYSEHKLDSLVFDEFTTTDELLSSLPPMDNQERELVHLGR